MNWSLILYLVGLIIPYSLRVTKQHNAHDILVTGSSSDVISSLIAALNLEQFNYLGVGVKRLSDGSLHVSQTKYKKHLLAS